MRRSRTIRNIKLGVKSLLLHKLRSLLTMLGVVFGVASVIGMLAVGEGSKQQAILEFERMGTNNIIINAREPIHTSGQSQQSGQRVLVYGPKYVDRLRIEETIPNVVRTVPIKRLRKTVELADRVAVDESGERQLEMVVVGTTPAWFEMIDRPIRAGRLFNQLDDQRLSPVVVITEQAARRLLVADHIVGATLNLGGRVFTVIGVVESNTAGASSLDAGTDAFIPLNTAQALYGDYIIERSAGSESRELIELHRIIVQMADRSMVERTAPLVRRLFEHFHPKVDYEISVPLELLRKAERVQGVMNLMLSAIAGISLLVGRIGIMNIMLASVTERTREIGVRRAIGAKRGQIVGQFLIEALLLSSFGGLIGMALGTWGMTGGIEYLSRQMDQPIKTIVPGYAIGLSLGISVLVGVGFGLYPAVRASRLDPIVALRHE
jgi:putative ABC transport system permease protein